MKKLLTAVIAVTAGIAMADTIVLKSGSRLSGGGAIVAGDVVKFTSDDLGDITIPVANVVSVETAADKEPVAVAALPIEEKPPETWHGSVTASFTAQRGNTYNNSGSLLADVNRRWTDDRLTAAFGYYYSENGKAGGIKEKTEDRWEVMAQHDHFWSERLYHYETGKFERDDIQALDARYSLGLGGGYQWLEKRAFDSTGTWSFNQEAGINWIKEDYAHGGSKEEGFAALRYAHHLTYVPKWNLGVEIFHNLEILPEVDEWEKFLGTTDLGFTTKLIYDFDLLAKIECDYNSNPASDRKKYDTRYIVGLGYKW